MAGLYLHIPFCKQACNYCNFHFSTSLKQEDRMVDAICREIELRKTYLKKTPLSTIYFGGGTPSIISNSNLEKIFHCIHKYFTLENNIEITLEANPDDINTSKLDHWKSMGINRLSVGLQSLHQEELSWMNRAHDISECYTALELISSDSDMEYSVDLIFGVHLSTIQSWKENLKIICSYMPNHISCYALTVEPNTALFHTVRKNKENLPSDDLSKDQFYLADEILGTHGYDHYEISNYALGDQYAKHNTSYWKSKPYLGIGPSAHSFDGFSRSWNAANNAFYMNAILDENKVLNKSEDLSLRDQYNEYLMTRLRTKWGCSPIEIVQQFGDDYFDHFQVSISHFIQNGTLELLEDKKMNRHYILNKKEWIVADQVISELFLIN